MNAQERLLERVEEEIKFLSRWDGPDDCRQTKLLSDLRGEIQRQDRHLERLGSGEFFADPIPEDNFYQRDRHAHVEYARTHRFEDE